MGELRRFGPGGRDANAKLRLSKLSERQFGRVSAAQLRKLGVGTSTVGRWLEDAYLFRVLPDVDAVGHRAPSTEGDLAAALLYAGPGAMLSHASAAWWYGLLDARPRTIHLSTGRRCRSIPGLIVRTRRELPRIWRNGLPVTTPAQALLDLAATAPLETARYALANADYHHLFDLNEITPLLGRGRPGSATLRQAITAHQPLLALTKSQLERDFLGLCERYRIPLPEVNARVEGFTVDAVWREQRVVVELDGYDNHATPAQIERDHRRDLRLRAAGYLVVRYGWNQINHQASLVAGDVNRLLRRG